MKPTPPTEDPLRPHSYDGIQEYDKRLPNWWLNTLYGSIAFAIVYWMWFQSFRTGQDGPQRIASQMAEIETRRLSSVAGDQMDDAGLWKMSQNTAFVEAGRLTFATTCAACHLASLRGKTESPAAIGPDLTDTNWIHGGKPLEIRDTITHGVLTKGMPAWGPVLGPRKVTDVLAYILHHHQEGEPIVVEAAAPAPTSN